MWYNELSATKTCGTCFLTGGIAYKAETRTLTPLARVSITALTLASSSEAWASVSVSVKECIHIEVCLEQDASRETLQAKETVW